MDTSPVAFDVFGATAIATVIDPVIDRRVAAEVGVALLEGVATTHGVRNLVVDLQNVSSLDSSCLGMLVEVRHALHARGGAMVVAGAGARVEVLFKLTKLDKLFPLCRTASDALSLLSKGAA